MAVELSEDLKREIGQHFVFGFPEPFITEDVKTLIWEWHVGNITDFSQVRCLIRDLQRLAHDAGHDRPLMIGIDQENGLSSRFTLPNGKCGTQFPGAMALAASGSPALVYESTSASAKELKLAGFNWVFSPVADINSDARNPVIGVRSYGDDPAKATPLIQSVARAFSENGIAPCAKHFPGHGDTHVDSHIALPVISKTLEELHATELVSFKALAAPSPPATTAAVASMMTAHIALPLVPRASLSDGDPGDSNYPDDPSEPASLSRTFTHALLRTSLAYPGVIVTDCLEMDAISGGIGCSRGAIQALQAGADVVMICHRIDRQLAALRAVYDAVKAREVDAQALRASGQRVAKMKDEYAGRWEDVLSGTEKEEGGVRARFASLREENDALSHAAYLRTIALVHSLEPAILPISKSARLILLTPLPESISVAIDEAPPSFNPHDTPCSRDDSVTQIASPAYLSLASFLRAQFSGGNVLHDVYGPSYPRASLKAAMHAQDVVLFVLRNGTRGTWQRFVLDMVQAELARQAVEGKHVKLVIVSSCAPYDALQLLTDVREGEAEGRALGAAVLATFEFTTGAFRALADVLVGDDTAGGSVPVSL